jgi:hypothetical protein
MGRSFRWLVFQLYLLLLGCSCVLLDYFYFGRPPGLADRGELRVDDVVSGLVSSDTNVMSLVHMRLWLTDSGISRPLGLADGRELQVGWCMSTACRGPYIFEPCFLRGFG